MNYEVVFAIVISLLFWGGIANIAYGQDITNPIPIKIDLEVKRNYNFLKLLVSVKNSSKDFQQFNLRLIVYKKNNVNISKVVQTKEIQIKSNEFMIPFITEFAINPQDLFEVKVQVFDVAGMLLMEKVWYSADI